MSGWSCISFTPGCELEEQIQVPELTVMISSLVVLLPAARGLLRNSRQHEESVMGRANWESFADLSASISCRYSLR